MSNIATKLAKHLTPDISKTGAVLTGIELSGNWTLSRFNEPGKSLPVIAVHDTLANTRDRMVITRTADPYQNFLFNPSQLTISLGNLQKKQAMYKNLSQILPDGFVSNNSSDLNVMIPVNNPPTPEIVRAVKEVADLPELVEETLQGLLSKNKVKPQNWLETIQPNNDSSLEEKPLVNHR